VPLEKKQEVCWMSLENGDCSKKYLQVRPQGALKETIQYSWESCEAFKVARLGVPCTAKNKIRRGKGRLRIAQGDTRPDNVAFPVSGRVLPAS